VKRFKEGKVARISRYKVHGFTCVVIFHRISNIIHIYTPVGGAGGPPGEDIERMFLKRKKASLA
jgi:hypothetical protein